MSTGAGDGAILEALADVREAAPDAREAAIAAACAGDAALESRLRRLLALSDARDDFMATPPIVRALSEDLVAEEATRRGLTPGTLVGPYRVARHVGSGAMGDVYEAAGPDGRVVAVKLVRPGVVDAESRRRFAFEAATLARLRHPNIARLVDFGTHQGDEGPRPFLAMEFVRGASITEHGAARALGPEARGALFLGVCAGVEHAHRSGVIHRDLKPANILVDEGSGEPRVLDFGVARTVDAEGTLATRPGAGVLGSVPYMSPQLLRGAAADTLSDVYALGATLYELLAGRPAFDPGARSLAALVHDVLHAQPEPLGRADAALRGAPERIVSRAMARDPALRYQSVSALAEDVRRWLAGEPLSSQRPGTLELLRALARRQRVALRAAAVALPVVLALGAFGGLQALRARDAEARSEQMLREITESSRLLVIDLTDRLARTGQPLAARREALEATVTYLAGVRRRAGDDHRVLTQLGMTHRLLGSALGSGGVGSLGMSDEARQQFLIAAELLSLSIRLRDTDEARESLSSTMEQLALLHDGEARARYLEEAVRAARVVLARAEPGPRAAFATRRAAQMEWRLAYERRDADALRRVTGMYESLVRAAPDDADLWSELGLVQRFLLSVLVDTDPAGAMTVAEQCATSLRRSIGLGNDDFTNNRHLANTELDMVRFSPGVFEGDDALRHAEAALARSRRVWLHAPGDNFRRLSHAVTLNAFASACLAVIERAPPGARAGLATRAAATIHSELDALGDSPPEGSPHPDEALNLRDARRVLEALQALHADG